MKRLLIILSVILASLTTFADRTFSFGQISCYSPQTGLVHGGGSVISVTIGDGYIILPLYGKLYRGQTNYDGSVAYYPSGFAGSSLAQLQGVLISADLQRMEEHLTSSYGGMTCQMINTYTNAGEDGGRYANSYSEGWMNSQRGKYDHSDSDSRSGSCSYCKGTGIDPTPNTGGHRTEWVGYYNSRGQECPYCRSYTSHFHDRCMKCNVPR